MHLVPNHDEDIKVLARQAILGMPPTKSKREKKALTFGLQSDFFIDPVDRNNIRKERRKTRSMKSPYHVWADGLKTRRFKKLSSAAKYYRELKMNGIEPWISNVSLGVAVSPARPRTCDMRCMLEDLKRVEIGLSSVEIIPPSRALVTTTARDRPKEDRSRLRSVDTFVKDITPHHTPTLVEHRTRPSVPAGVLENFRNLTNADRTLMLHCVGAPLLALAVCFSLFM